MTRLLGTKASTLQMMQQARAQCAKVTILEPRSTPQAQPKGPARILPFTKSRSGG